MDFAAHLAHVLALSRGGEVRVRFLSPLRAADFADRKALAEAARGAIVDAFNEMSAAPR
jgi:1-acyl-sn-glycerol-3-phosphate acyltransferase